MISDSVGCTADVHGSVDCGVGIGVTQKTPLAEEVTTFGMKAIFGYLYDVWQHAIGPCICGYIC
jgi:hypothetical protein